MRYVYLFVCTVLISATLAQGCALIGQPIADKVAKAATKYCEEPLSARQTYRQTINAELARYGHELHVHCAGDPDALAPEN